MTDPGPSPQAPVAVPIPAEVVPRRRGGLLRRGAAAAMLAWIAFPAVSQPLRDRLTADLAMAEQVFRGRFFAQEKLLDDALDEALDDALDEEAAGGRDFERREVPGGMDRMFVPRWRLTSGPQTRSAFREVVQNARGSVLCVHLDGTHAALACVVASDGWILTKASPLKGEITCRLPDGREFPAEIVRVSGELDLALLKIDAEDLPVIQWAPQQVPQVGTWLASVGKNRDPVAVGVVSVAPRAIPAQHGVLGVQLDEQAGPPKVVSVFRKSGADAAGVLVNDVIRRVNDQPILTREALIRAIRGYNPGDEVELEIEREGETTTLRAVLQGHFPGLPDRSEFQNNLGTSLSVRRFGFPQALQHDAVLRAADCGGPVVNLDGEVVGINIARAGRTETYALPAAAVSSLLEDWLAPAAAEVDRGARQKTAVTSEAPAVAVP